MIWKTSLVLFLSVGALGSVISKERLHAKNIVNQMCLQNLSEDEKLSMEDKLLTYGNCVQDLIDGDLLMSKIQYSTDHNDVTVEIYKMYCAKSDVLKTCLHTLINDVTPCLNKSFKIESAMNASNELIDFLCYNDAERIITFTREGGFDCILEDTDKIKKCASKVTDPVDTAESIKQMNVEQLCSLYDEISTCTLNKIKECSSPVPAKMAETVMQYVRKGSPCK